MQAGPAESLLIVKKNRTATLELLCRVLRYGVMRSVFSVTA